MGSRGSTVEGAAIPRYGLFGDASDPVGVEFIHAEDVRGRSEALDWHIHSHAHPGLAQLLVVGTGSVRVSLEGEVRNLASPALLTLPSGVVHGFRFEPGTVGVVVTLATTWLDAAPLAESTRSALFGAPRAVGLESGPAADQLVAAAELVLTEFASSGLERAAVLPWLAQSLLVLAARCVPVAATGERRGDDVGLVRRLRALIDAHHTEHWSLDELARALHVSASTLNRACGAVAGCTAFELSQRRLELEARRRLVFIDAPVAAISTELGFDDPAYFSRFFRRRCGMSPSEFRREQRTVLAG